LLLFSYWLGFFFSPFPFLLSFCFRKFCVRYLLSGSCCCCCIFQFGKKKVKCYKKISPNRHPPPLLLGINSIILFAYVLYVWKIIYNCFGSCFSYIEKYFLIRNTKFGLFFFSLSLILLLLLILVIWNQNRVNLFLFLIVLN